MIIFPGGLGSMTIGIDAGCLGIVDSRLKTGVYHFSVNILTALSQLVVRNKYLLYSFAPIDQKLVSRFGPSFKNIVLRPKRGWLSFRLSAEFLLKKPDIFLGFSQALPSICPSKSIVYVHDLAFEHFPHCYKGSFSRLRRITKFAVSRCTKIIAVSGATKKDLIKLYNVQGGKIKVVYHGVSSNFYPQPKEKLKEIKTKYKISKPYFLYVGSLKPIKNLPRVIKAFAIFLRNTKEDYRLVLVGSNYWTDDGIRKTIGKTRLKNKISILDSVENKDLPVLYSGAQAFVSPALFEGFGMPILEAMACGCPVVTSNTGSAPEIAGKHAIIVNPYSEQEIADALRRLSVDQKLIDRLKRKGVERSRQFTWQKSAKALLRLITLL